MAILLGAFLPVGQPVLAKGDQPLYPEAMMLRDRFGCAEDVPGPRALEPSLLAAADYDSPVHDAFVEGLERVYHEASPHEALRRLEARLSEHPRSYLLHEMRLKLLTMMEASPGAIGAAAQEMSAVFPGAIWPLLYHGEYLEILGDIEAAYPVYREAVQRRPDNFHSNLDFARAASRTGRDLAALYALDRAAELAPLEHETYCWRIVVRYNLDPGPEGLAAAVRDFSRALKLSARFREEYLDLLVGMQMVEGHVTRLEDPEGELRAPRVPGLAPGALEAHGGVPRKTQRWSPPLDLESVTDQMLADGFVNWVEQGMPEPMM